MCAAAAAAAARIGIWSVLCRVIHLTFYGLVELLMDSTLGADWTVA
jgi:hypothetical protein